MKSSIIFNIVYEFNTTAIVSNIKSDMTQMEKYAARFRMFKK